jgi:hypothetical protein
MDAKEFKEELKSKTVLPQRTQSCAEESQILFTARDAMDAGAILESSGLFPGEEDKHKVPPRARPSRARLGMTDG